MTSSLWILFTIIAVAGQVARNAMQRELTQTLGTVGATHVRFLFGFPFALVFLAIVTAIVGGIPRPPAAFWPWIVTGAFSQTLATALMLAAMRERSFVVTTAYLKTEPVQVALFGLIFLGDLLSLPMVIGILVATVGVILMSWKARAEAVVSFRPTVSGLAAATGFALAAVGFRGAILSLDLPNFVMAATFTLAIGLAMQAVFLSLYLLLREPKVMRDILHAWRPSMLAGFLGAAASQFWFLAFALAAAASVRTLALVEVLFAQAIASVVFGQKTTLREAAGIALVVAGVVLLIWAH